MIERLFVYYLANSVADISFVDDFLLNRSVR